MIVDLSPIAVFERLENWDVTNKDSFEEFDGIYSIYVSWVSSNCAFIFFSEKGEHIGCCKMDRCGRFYDYFIYNNSRKFGMQDTEYGREKTISVLICFPAFIDTILWNGL